MEISFEELAEKLRNFTTRGNGEGYDSGGALYLLGACLDNLEKNVIPGELEEVAERLEPNQIALLKKLAELAGPSTQPE